MPLSAIDLCSQALVKIGGNPIQSFDEGTAEATIAAQLYPTLRDALISAHRWNFALGQARLARLAAVPVADYAYAYQLPPDMLSIVSAGANERGRGLTYRLAEQRLHTDSTEVYLTYTFLPAPALFPPFFSLALVARLAAEFAIPLTESTTRWDGLRQVAEFEFRRARLIDSQQDTPETVEDFVLVAVRS
jgi:hypothetical protein